MTPPIRRILAVVLLVIPPVVALVIWLAVRGELPHPMATHWKLDGTPDGFTSPGGFAALMLTVSAALSVAGAGMVVLDATHARTGALAGIFAWTSWIFASTLTDAVLSGRGVANAHDVHSGWTHAVPLVVLSLVAGIVTWRLVPAPGSTIDVEAAALSSIDLAPGERAVWVGSASSRALLRIGGLATGLGVLAFVVVVVLEVAGVLSSGDTADASVLLTAVAMVLVGLALLWCHSVSVRVDATGVTVRLGGAPWPRFHVPIAAIEAAAVETIYPSQWGGWGYRLGGRRGTAIVVRKGPGVVLARKGRSDFAITVDDADAAAQLINALVRPRAS